MTDRPLPLPLCGALLLAACLTKGAEMRTVTPVKKTYLHAEAVDGGSVETPPQVLEEVRPTAPEGVASDPRPSVVARFTVDPEGRIHDIQLSQATDPRLLPLTTQALSRWKLAPARRDGRPISAVATVQLLFDLPGREP